RQGPQPPRVGASGQPRSWVIPYTRLVQGITPLMKIAVIGAGKMGLPLACQFAHRGGDVIACDINPALVAAINEGRCSIDEPCLRGLLPQVTRGGRLHATTETAAAVSESEVAVVIVPALLTERREIDTSILEAATREVARGLHRDMMVC